MNHGVTTDHLVSMIFTGIISFVLMVFGLVAVVFTQFVLCIVLVSIGFYFSRVADRKYNDIRRKLGLIE